MCQRMSYIIEFIDYFARNLQSPSKFVHQDYDKYDLTAFYLIDL